MLQLKAQRGTFTGMKWNRKYKFAFQFRKVPEKQTSVVFSLAANRHLYLNQGLLLPGSGRIASPRFYSGPEGSMMISHGIDKQEHCHCLQYAVRPLDVRHGTFKFYCSVLTNTVIGQSFCLTLRVGPTQKSDVRKLVGN